MTRHRPDLGSLARACVGLVLLPAAALAADDTTRPAAPGSVRPDVFQSGETFQLPPLQVPSTTVPSLETSAIFRLERVVFRGNTVFSTSELS